MHPAAIPGKLSPAPSGGTARRPRREDGPKFRTQDRLPLYKLFLTLRYLRKRRIAYFAIAAVVLCTAMVVIVMSVMGGFLDQLKFKARGLLGDIIVDNYSPSGFPLYEEFIADISDPNQWPEIAKATPVIYSFGLLRFQGSTLTSAAQVVGIRLEDVYVVNAFKSSLYYEKYYPGTTTLAEQRQPVLGFDLQHPAVEWRDEKGEVMVRGPRPVLPPPYQAALEQSWGAGVRDAETTDNYWTATCRAYGGPIIAGEYKALENEALGPPEMTGEPYPGLIIGRDIIAERQADGRYQRYWQRPRGCVMSLTLVPVSLAGTLDTPIKQPFRYADDSRTGIYEIDSRHVYCDFDLLQKLLQMQRTERKSDTGEVIGTVPGRCSQIQIKLHDQVKGRPVDPYAVAKRLETLYQGYSLDRRFNLTLDDLQLIQRVHAKTWEESQAHIIAPVEKERQLVTILFGIISLVAAVLVLCILYMIVLQKTRDIGIVKSIGGSSAGVAAIFVTYGAAVGIVGSIVGAALGTLFVHNINRIQDFLVWAFGWRVWDRSVYSFDDIPSTVRPGEVLFVVAAAIAASTIGALAAAWRAGGMQPVEAIRHE